VPDEYKYSEEVMRRKEEFYQKRKNTLDGIFEN
jgi:hypothetical protein